MLCFDEPDGENQMAGRIVSREDQSVSDVAVAAAQEREMRVKFAINIYKFTSSISTDITTTGE